MPLYSRVLGHHRFHFPALWTSRGHGRRLFSPPSGACLHFYRGEGSAFPPLVEFHRFFLGHAVALSATRKTARRVEKKTKKNGTRVSNLAG